jgi:hypothetical protein
MRDFVAPLDLWPDGKPQISAPDILKIVEIDLKALKPRDPGPDGHFGDRIVVHQIVAP